MCDKNIFITVLIIRQFASWNLSVNYSMNVEQCVKKINKIYKVDDVEVR